MRKGFKRTAWLGLPLGVLFLAACGERGGAASGAASETPSPSATAPATASADASAEGAAGPIDATPGVLAVGDAAPPLSAARWFRGESRDAVTPGRVTLVEFWATWCGPCIAAMPHISELADRLGPEGLDVVGVSIDRGETAARVVEQFLETRSEIVSFEVMLDSGETSRAWLEAAGRSGIPCSFVVSQDGRLAWIGHPMEPARDGSGFELDRVIAGLLDGSYDIDAQARSASASAAEQASQEARIAELSADMGRLWSQGDRLGVLTYIDQIIEIDAEGSRDLAQRKIEILLYELGEPGLALSAARDLLSGPYASDSSVMLTLAALFSGSADPGDEGRAFAVGTAERVVAMTDGTEPNSLVVLAEAQFSSGRAEAAADTMRAAMALVDETSPAFQTYELVLSRYLDAAGGADPAEDESGLSAGG